MQKTLGGDRLGSGNRMKVELHNYERSTHDMGYVWRSTQAAGTLVPFLCEVGLPGDTFDIKLGVDHKTHPTIGPLFGSYKSQIDVFIAPMRLYHSALHNNALGIGRNMSQVKLPQIVFPVPKNMRPQDIKDLDNCQVNPSSLPAYLGIRGFGINTTEYDTTRELNAIPVLALWEIYKNYFANKQEEIGAVIHNDNVQVVKNVTAIKVNNTTTIHLVPPGTPTNITLKAGDLIDITFSGTAPDPNNLYVYRTAGSLTLAELCNPFTQTNATTLSAVIQRDYAETTITGWNYVGAYDIKNIHPKVATFPLSNIDDMRNAILSTPPNQVFKITDSSPEPYCWLTQAPNGVRNILSTQEGLPIKTYQSDMFNNWLKTENIEAISTATAIDTTTGSFTIDQLVLSKKVYNMLNRINVSGGSYDDWIDAVYVHDRYQRAESPIYCGGLIKELIFQEVVSNSESTSGQPLGTLAGKGTMAQKHKGGDLVIRIDEPSYIIGLVSLTPRIDYSQGSKWDTNLKTMDDFHKPQLDEIGFQELVVEQAAWWTTKYNHTDDVWEQVSAGKQPAWLNYMTNVNQVRGNFAINDNEMFMTLNRRYEYNDDGTIKDLTTYIDPAKFNFIFAETSLDAQNFWTQIGVDITARRKMSAKIMPNL